MKHFLLFAILVIGLDHALGFLLNRLYLRTTTGEGGGLINCALRQDPDILVLGSSRAKHHVVPAILKEKLSGSVFNAGVNGQDFLYAMMLIDLWTRSHSAPKVILLHLDPQSLSYSSEEIARTSVFSSYFGVSDRITSILLMRGKYEWLKYCSYSYRFNGKVLPILKNLAIVPDKSFDGYVGLSGSLRFNSVQDIITAPNRADGSAPFWDLKIGYLRELAQYCLTNNTKLILFHSPLFHENPETLAAWTKRLMGLNLPEGTVHFLDFNASTNVRLVERFELFKDAGHLNAKGSEIFSQILAEKISATLYQVTKITP